MKEQIKSEGKCFFCGKTFTMAGINRHLAAHLQEKAASGAPGKSFLLKVETTKRWGATPYFLSLWMDGETEMQELDSFLRKIWLECCRHRSEFRIEKEAKEKKAFRIEQTKLLQEEKFEESFQALNSFYDTEIFMNDEAKLVLHKGFEFIYTYDFRNTTSLIISVTQEYAVKADSSIVLLSRNEPLRIICCECGKIPATKLCPICVRRKEACFCDQCAKEHAKKCDDFDDAGLPVVNSPRMGICGYTGGTIDKERDGCFMMVGK